MISERLNYALIHLGYLHLYVYLKYDTFVHFLAAFDLEHDGLTLQQMYH